MAYIHKTKGTCSKQITVELEGNIIKSVSFLGGCNGNLSGIAKLVEGMPIEHVIARFAGTKCDSRATSCPAQLAIALQAAYDEAKGE